MSRQIVTATPRVVGRRLRAQGHQTIPVPESSGSWVWATLGAAASQAVMITALLYYFGWVRTQVTFAYFGVDTSLLNLTTTDYILRSTQTVLPPLIVIAMVAIVLVCIHRWVVPPAIRATARSHWWLRATLTVTQVVALLLATMSVISLFSFARQVPDSLIYAMPWCLVFAGVLFGYAEWLRISIPLRPDEVPTRPTTSAQVQLVIWSGVVMFGLLWALHDRATDVGDQAAKRVAAGMVNRPAIMIYSMEDIAITGPGVTVERIRQPNSRYRFCYTGLRLLIRSSDRYFLVPAEWRQGRDSVYMVPDDSHVRIDVVAGPSIHARRCR
jgi:hypothetical protein